MSTFWINQPVQLNESDKKNIEEQTSILSYEKTSNNPTPLIDGFEWCFCDISNNKTLKEIHDLLSENYVEDRDSLFRMNYSISFLKWALTSSDKINLNLGIKLSSNNTLIGFISAVPLKCRLVDKELNMVEINFLCVHKKLRSNNFTPLLIKEITRRANCMNYRQAVYTGGKKIHYPLAESTYYHRMLNIKKLIHTNFTTLQPRWTVSMLEKYYRLTNKNIIKNMRLMKKKDVPQINILLNKYLEKYDMAPVFNDVEIEHKFMPQKDIVYSFVVEDDKENLTDFISYFIINTDVTHHKHKHLKVAYCYYYANTKHNLIELFESVIILAKKNDCDVFNCLNIMNNSTIFEKLKFVKGNGDLNYFIYNWRYKQIEPIKIGLIFV